MDERRARAVVVEHEFGPSSLLSPSSLDVKLYGCRREESSEADEERELTISKLWYSRQLSVWS